MELYGKAPTDLNAFVRVLRRILAKNGLNKEAVAICYEAGPTGACWSGGCGSWASSAR